MGRLLWDETVYSLCSRSPHGETVVARRAQLRVDRLIPLFLGCEEGEGFLEVLADRAPSEGPRSTRRLREEPPQPIVLEVEGRERIVRRAQWGNQSAHDLRSRGKDRATRGLRRIRREWPGALLARRTRTIRMCSHGKRARLGAFGVGWVRMLRTVKNSLAAPFRRETSKLGRISLYKALVGRTQLEAPRLPWGKRAKRKQVTRSSTSPPAGLGPPRPSQEQRQQTRPRYSLPRSN